MNKKVIYQTPSIAYMRIESQVILAGSTPANPIGISGTHGGNTNGDTW